MIIKILSLILILSCSSLKRDISSVDSEVSRIVRMGFIFDEYNLKDTDLIKLKFKVYKFSMFVSRDVEVSIENLKGQGSIDKYSSRTNNKGIVEFYYSPKEQNEDVSLDVIAADKIYNVKFKIIGASRKKAVSIISLKPKPVVLVKPKIKIPKLKPIPLKPVINYINSKIEIKNSNVIPSGIDSFDIMLKLDSNDDLIPSLRLEGAVSNDLERIDKGLYRATIIPKQNSKVVDIQMYVGTELIDSKKVELSFKPIVDEITDDTSGNMMIHFNDIPYGVKDYVSSETHPTGRAVNFTVTNYGENSIVPGFCAPTVKGNEDSCKPQRVFHFNFRDQAYQNLSIGVDDYVNTWTSQSMHTKFILFPRLVIPSIKLDKERNTKTVTLPTKEEVVFNLETSEIISGVLEEGPMDVVSKNRFSRKFANIRYKGKGVAIRINARGQTPSQGQFNNNTISGDFGDTGAKKALIYKYDEQSKSIIKCLRPKSELWEQGDINPIPFKFKTDEDFRKYLAKHCEFSF